MADLNQTLGNISKDKQGIREEIGYKDNAIPLFIVNEGTAETPNNLNVYHSPCKISVRDCSGDTIWGNFNWGSANWDSSYNNSRVVYRIINPDNIFREYFRTTTYIDTDNSTATIDTTNNRVVF